MTAVLVALVIVLGLSALYLSNLCLRSLRNSEALQAESENSELQERMEDERSAYEEHISRLEGELVSLREIRDRCEGSEQEHAQKLVEANRRADGLVEAIRGIESERDDWNSRYWKAAQGWGAAQSMLMRYIGRLQQELRRNKLHVPASGFEGIEGELLVMSPSEKPKDASEGMPPSEKPKDASEGK